MKFLPVLTALLAAAATAFAAPPFINEFLAINHGPLSDDLGRTSDWIEIKNPGPGSINLAGWTLTDEPDLPAKWVFPSIILQEGELLVVRASGEDHRVAGQTLHTNFTLSGGGEFLGLYSDDEVATSVWQPYPKQFGGISYGLVSGAEQGYFTTPSPGVDNDLTALTDYVRDTHFSVERGFYIAPFSVTLTCDTPGAAIRYTTDGSLPLENSALYAAPVNITTTTVLRARGFKDNMVPSNADTQTYIFAAAWKSQPDFPAGFSVSWGQFDANFKVLADYGMNPGITNHATYGPLVISAMTQTFTVNTTVGFLVTAPRKLFLPPGGRDLGITWKQSRPARVVVTVESPAGEVVRTLARRVYPASTPALVWNGLDRTKGFGPRVADNHDG